MKKINIILACFLILFIAFPTLAKIEPFANGDYVLNKDTIIERNLYKAGKNLIINGEVKGDLISAGQNINIFNKIGQDVASAGQNINLMVEVNGDARLAGATIIIGGNIKGDTIIFSGETHILANNNLDGDIFIASGNVIIDGNLNGAAKISGGKIIINGRVGQDTIINAGQELVIGDSAVIDGKIEYKSPKEAVIASGAKINKEMSFKKIEPIKTGAGAKKGASLLAVFTAFWLLKLFAVLLAALILFFLFPKWVKNFANNVASNFSKEAIRGFALLILIPVAIIFSFITVIGMFLGVFGIFAYIAFIMVASVLSGIVLGSLIYRFLSDKKEYVVDWKSILVGVIAMFLIGLIPIIGWLAMFILFLACLGNFYYSAYQKIWLEK